MAESSAALAAVAIVPAIMPKDRNELHLLADLLHPFAQSIQLDVADGLLTPETTWPFIAPGQAEHLGELPLPFASDLVWEAHLMTKQPQALGEQLIDAGVKRVIAHIESCGSVEKARAIFESWHTRGAEVGISLLLDTPISAIEDLIHDVEFVQVMSIAEIGAQGHPFDPRTMVRVRELRNRYPHIVITVDGGVNIHNAPDLVAAGANRLCVGSAIVRAEDPLTAYEELMHIVSRPEV